MITQLRFKNWRSLKDVTIDDLGKITVFIGANSSGKTNILDAIRFRRDSLIKGLVSTVQEMGYTKIQTDALHNDENVELEYTYKIPISIKPIRETLVLKFDKRDFPFDFGTRLYEGEKLLQDNPLREYPRRAVIESEFSETSEQASQNFPNRYHLRKVSDNLIPLILKRWQILGENFHPFLNLSRNQGGDPYTIEPDAHNTLRILELMMKGYPSIYERLEEDLKYILAHVNQTRIWQEQESGEIQFIVDEDTGKTAPTISSGTARLIAILAAIYGLDMPQEITSSSELEVLTADMSGLVVIEEPDMGLNPGVLRRFVEQIRTYAEGENPRQFIFTTHNPTFLDFFEPEEVRVVKRDEQGYTQVEKIPAHIKDIWLDEYGLGEVWTTNSFGGIPE